MSDFISNVRAVHSGELCKTYRQHYKTKVRATTTLKTLTTFPALTIQADRKFKVGFFVPSRGFGNIWGGVYFGYNIKINGVQYNLGSSGKVMGMVNDSETGALHSNVKIVDPIGINICQPGQDYTIQFSITSKAASGSAAINDADINRPSRGKGAALQSAKNQGYMNLIIEELVR